MKEIVRILRQILATLTASNDERLAYTYPMAAAVASISTEKIRQHIARGTLVPSYVDSKPVIMHEELVRWLRTLPAERSAP